MGHRQSKRYSADADLPMRSLLAKTEYILSDSSTLCASLPSAICAVMSSIGLTKHASSQLRRKCLSQVFSSLDTLSMPPRNDARWSTSDSLPSSGCCLPACVGSHFLVRRLGAEHILSRTWAFLRAFLPLSSQHLDILYLGGDLDGQRTSNLLAELRAHLQLGCGIQEFVILLGRELGVLFLRLRGAAPRSSVGVRLDRR
jgi:hypothetical protein